MRIYELTPREVVPYALIKIESSPYPHTWLAVNRDYARPDSEWNWEAHLDKAVVFRRDPRGFDCWAEVNVGCLYLYLHEYDSAADYHERLQRLFAEEWSSFRKHRLV